MNNHFPPKLSLVFPLIFAFSMSVSAQNTKTELIAVGINWQKFESVDGGFSVRFPAAPKIGKALFTKGPVTFMRHTHEAKWDSYFFEVDYWDVSTGDDPDQKDPELIAEGGIAGMIRSVEAKGGRVLSKTSLVKDGCHGREARMSLPMPVQGREGFSVGRVFTSGERTYAIIFVSVSGDPMSRIHSQTFLDSFTITPRCSPRTSPATPTAATPKATMAGKPDPVTGWRRIESGEHGFSALMPGAAEVEVTVPQTKPYKLTHYTFTHDSDLGMFSIEVLGDYPPGFHNDPESMKTLLDITTYAVKQNLEPAGFVVVPTRELRLGTFPGQEFALSLLKTGKGRARVYVTSKRVYIAISVSAKAKPADVDQFFSALQITP